MNPANIAIAAGLAGVVGGFIAGYFTGKTKAEETAEQHIQDEIKKITDEFTLVKKPEPLPEGVEAFVPPELTEEEEAHLREEFDKHITHYNKVRDDLTEKEQEVDGMNIVEMTDEETGEEIEVVNPSELDDGDDYDDPNDDDDLPMHRVLIISPEDYKAGEAGQLREEFTYYEVDDILTDSDSVPIEVDNLDAALSSFGVFGADKDEVFVRNRHTRTDMHIVMVHKAYQEEILGVPWGEEDDASPKKMKDHYE